MRIALAAKCPIFEYAAPAELGSGTLKIYVAGHTAVWDNDELLLVYEKRHVPKPHAALALNAGFGAYRTWGEACFLAHTADLPFAVTEYMEQALEMIRKTYVRAFPSHVSPSESTADGCTPVAPSRDTGRPKSPCQPRCASADA